MNVLHHPMFGEERTETPLNGNSKKLFTIKKL